MRLVFDCNVLISALLFDTSLPGVALLRVKSISSTLLISNPVLCRDPKDDMYLELALSGKADCIITGDPDLLVLNSFENIPIITPKEFLDSISKL